MVTTIPPAGPVLSPEDERTALAEIAASLEYQPNGRLCLVDERGTRLEVPESLRRVLRRVVAAMARGRVIEVVSFPPELTIQRVAGLLDVPASTVVQLLDQGEMPSTMAEGIRRVRFEDVMAYRERRDAEQKRAMLELVRLSEDMGLYEDDGPAPTES